ncbi:hypothetical protein B0H10DRAFT_1941478 [Mycena sp. CBHHK59/15]|nr:hypothetical protein B0H10DRAFT_1941478 [Mycena sp. CBHHK59/15]
MWIIVHIFVLHFLSVLCFAATTNQTIDNSYGDSVTGTVPTYSPSSAWAGRRYHTTTTVNFKFTLGGSRLGSYTHTPTASTALQYNVLVHSGTSLSNSAYSLTTSTQGTDGIYGNFDRAIYTSTRRDVDDILRGILGIINHVIEDHIRVFDFLSGNQ